MRLLSLSILILFLAGCASQTEIMTTQPGWQVQEKETTSKKTPEEDSSIDLREIF